LKQQNLPGEEKPRTVSYQVLSILIEEPITEERSRGRSKETIVSHVTVVVLFEPVFPDMLTVHAGKWDEEKSYQSVDLQGDPMVKEENVNKSNETRTQSYSFITGVRSSTTPIPVTKADLTQAASDYGVIGRERKALESIVQSELAFALQYPEAELRTLHTTAWNRVDASRLPSPSRASTSTGDLRMNWTELGRAFIVINMPEVEADGIKIIKEYEDCQTNGKIR
ncbi:hypothetical protein X801_09638, partial [Opisthorchis viverrini]